MGSRKWCSLPARRLSFQPTMIAVVSHKGTVTISLSHKDQNEFFTLHESNYFGDYQILMDLKASECYKSSVDSATYTHCLKKKDL